MNRREAASAVSDSYSVFRPEDLVRDHEPDAGLEVWRFFVVVKADEDSRTDSAVLVDMPFCGQLKSVRVGISVLFARLMHVIADERKFIAYAPLVAGSESPVKVANVFDVIAVGGVAERAEIRRSWPHVLGDNARQRGQGRDLSVVGDPVLLPAERDVRIAVDVALSQPARDADRELGVAPEVASVRIELQFRQPDDRVVFAGLCEPARLQFQFNRAGITRIDVRSQPYM